MIFEVSAVGKMMKVCSLASSNDDVVELRDLYDCRRLHLVVLAQCVNDATPCQWVATSDPMASRNITHYQLRMCSLLLPETLRYHYSCLHITTHYTIRLLSIVQLMDLSQQGTQVLDCAAHKRS